MNTIIKLLTALTVGLCPSFPISPSLRSSSDAVAGLDTVPGGGSSSSPSVGSLPGVRGGRTGTLWLVSGGSWTLSGPTGREFDLGLVCIEEGVGRFNIMMRTEDVSKT